MLLGSKQSSHICRECPACDSRIMFLSKGRYIPDIIQDDLNNMYSPALAANCEKLHCCRILMIHHFLSSESFPYTL